MILHRVEAYAMSKVLELIETFPLMVYALGIVMLVFLAPVMICHRKSI